MKFIEKFTAVFSVRMMTKDASAIDRVKAALEKLGGADKYAVLEHKRKKQSLIMYSMHRKDVPDCKLYTCLPGDVDDDTLCWYVKKGMRDIDIAILIGPINGTEGVTAH